MTTRLLIENIPCHFGDVELQRLVEPWGRVQSCRIVVNRVGRSLGFGYVEMSSDTENEEV